MLELYDNVSENCSKLVTRAYSTSFSLAIKTLHKSLHGPIYSIYGFVRLADEIVDTFHEYDKKSLLDEFRKDALKAINEKISLNPVIHCFQKVVNEYDIDIELVNAFLDSMEMDLNCTTYSDENYKKYIYGSAEVVGLMCLKVFCKGDKDEYESLKPFAMSLGSAFQKVNFLRDLNSDYSERGRIYFPGADFSNFNEQLKSNIEEDINKDFENALLGIKKLPVSARLGVYLAYIYYKALFKKIQKLKPENVLNARIRIPDSQKLYILLNTYFSYNLRLGAL